MQKRDYKAINKAGWDKRATLHVKSDFYNYEGFVNGDSSLNPIELGIFSNVKGKTLLHLQCHFGQDSIAWQRLGADVTGVDLSSEAIKQANILNTKCHTDVQFVCSDIFDLPQNLEGQFDYVFTSYGTIGWLPDLEKWATVVNHFLKPGGQFLIVDFHPVIWMFDDSVTKIIYSYFNTEMIYEEEKGSYADSNSDDIIASATWNHSISDLINSLINQGLTIELFNEYDYTPYDIFKPSIEVEPGKFQLEKYAGILPLTYALHVSKKD